MPAKPKSPFPNPATTLPGEADILANVLADLSDDNAKLVYADWLEDRDDPRGPLLREFITAFREGKKLPKVTAAPPGWRELVGITLTTKIRKVGYDEYAETLLRLARPAVTFKAARAAEANLAVGATKLGGRPDLPSGTKWPQFRRSPLSFLAQFNLAELHTSPVCRELPVTGVLSVFYDAAGEVFDNADKGGWRVFHFPEASKLTRQEFPDDLNEDDSRFRSCRLSFTEILTLPERDSPWGRELPPEDEEAEDDVYRQVVGEDNLGHRLLGYASNLQNDVHGRKNIRHLLTIDSDDAPCWLWGDSGLLYFTIRDDYLPKQQFDRTRFEMQCC